MKQEKTVLFLVILAMVTSFMCSAQRGVKTAVYNIHAMGMDVGTITVNQEVKDDEIFVEAISEVEVRIIFKIKVKYVQTSIYSNGVMKESLLEIYKKGKVNSTTRLTKNGKGYTLNKNGKVSYINDVIKYSGSLLWFHEPKEGMDMFFEISGEKTVVEPISAHEYSITDPHNGNKNEYNFKNGVLQKAIIKHTMANVYLKLKGAVTKGAGAK